MKRLRSTTLAVAAILATTFPAFSWHSKVEDVDVFGVQKALAGSSNGVDTLVIQCDNEDALHLAILEPVKEFEDIPTIPATLLIQVDNNDPVRLEAVYRSWNNNNAAVVASGRTRDLAQLVLLIADAKRSVNTGVEMNGIRGSANFSARGSTAAIRKLDQACKLSEITAE